MRNRVATMSIRFIKRLNKSGRKDRDDHDEVRAGWESRIKMLLLLREKLRLLFATSTNSCRFLRRRRDDRVRSHLSKWLIWISLFYHRYWNETLSTRRTHPRVSLIIPLFFFILSRNRAPRNDEKKRGKERKESSVWLQQKVGNEKGEVWLVRALRFLGSDSSPRSYFFFISSGSFWRVGVFVLFFVVGGFFFF